MRLRYVGSAPTTFVSIGLEVQPDDEFSVSDDDFPAYETRSDVVVVEDPKPVVVEKPSKARRSAVEESVTVDQPDSTEESAADVESNVS